MSITSYRKLADRLLQDRKTALAIVQAEEEALAAAEVGEQRALKAQNILQLVAQGTQQQAHEQIATVVTRCLQTVYGPDSHTFGIVFERKRGKTEARLVFYKEGVECSPSNVPGGVLDVAAFALRPACLLLSTPRRRRLLILDEPMKNVNGEEYQSRVGQLIEDLAEEMDFQFIIVSDDDWLKIGKVFEL